MESSRYEDFQPPTWLETGHVQTLAGRFLRSYSRNNYERHRLELEDGDFLDLDFDQSKEFFCEASTGHALLIHGLEGCSYSGYVLTTINHLRRQGIGCVAMNLRSCSGEPNRTPQFYHSGQTEDLGRVIRYLRELIGHNPLAGVGFSLGGNLLLKYLGENAPGTGLTSGAAVSVPFDLARGADHLNRGIGRLYEKYFLYQLKLKLIRKNQGNHYTLNLLDLPGITSLREFDDSYTAPLHGFDSADHYYRTSSSNQFLGSVSEPTLVLHARDDPFIPAEAIPEEKLTENESITVKLSDRGGHVGFVEGFGSNGVSLWAERTIANYLEEKLKEADTGTG